LIIIPIIFLMEMFTDIKFFDIASTGVINFALFSFPLWILVSFVSTKLINTWIKKAIAIEKN